MFDHLTSLHTFGTTWMIGAIVAGLIIWVASKIAE